MTTDVPRVKSSASVLSAAEAMNRAKSTGVAVVDEDDKVVGLLTARRLLWDFFALNKKPEDVKVSQVMGPFFRIGPNASAREAARKILAHSITRLGVFEDEKFLGWVSLTDLTRELGKRRLIVALRSREEPENPEFLCPKCRRAFMEKVTNNEGDILRWACPNCGYAL
jgi:signal-transduction protein with cAMP-binding, CBS, and nucleotidyltransferase domain/ribosomal protein S27AE